MRRIFAIIILGALLAFCINALIKEREANARLDRNITALTEAETRYKVRDSLNAVSVKTLEYTYSEMKRHLEDSIKGILSDMDIKLRDAQSITHQQLELNIELEGKIKILERGIYQYVYRDSYLQLEQTINTDLLSTRLKAFAPVNLTGVIHLDYKYRILWMRFRFRGARYDVVCDNPYVNINSINCVIKR